MAVWKKEMRDCRMYDWFDANGRRHRGYAPTRAAAERLREEKNVAARKAPQLREDADQTHSQYARQWLDELAGSDLKPRTIGGYTQLYSVHIAAVLGSIKLRELRHVHARGQHSSVLG